MQRLPEDQRRVLELACYEGLTQVEIAQKIRAPLALVKTRTALAMRQLRTALAPEIGELLGADSKPT
jgi:RNA polymerase sigma-70 factor (ECF subfamily)